MEANFVRRLKKSTSKYRGKVPFKCSNCGKIGHYASKCPRKVSNDKNKDHKGKYFKKSYYVKDNGIFDDEESNSLDGGSDEFLFMALNVGTNYTNLEICVKEIALKIGHYIEVTMLIVFHTREERKY